VSTTPQRVTEQTPHAAPPEPATAAEPVTYWQQPRGSRTPAATPATPSPVTATWAAAASPVALASPVAHGSPTGDTRSALSSLAGIGRSLTDLEDRLAGRALAWIGGAALVLGAIFFLSLAFSRGWIGPELRVLVGLAAGSLALAGGAAFMERDNRLLGHVLTPVGLATITISLIGATRLYDLVPVPVALLAALLSATIAAAIAVRGDSPVVAAFGLVAVLLAPPLLGATPDLTVLAFVGIVLIGTTAVSLWRSWRWLPPLAFALSAPQAASWFLGDPDPTLGLVGLAAFWLLNAVAAGGEEFRRHRDDLSPSSATLLLADAAFAVWAGFVLLSGDLEPARGLFLITLALANLVLGGYFVLRDGERNLFGLLALGTGIATITLAAAVQLQASTLPVAWTAEAVALAWLASRRGHPYSAAVSGILYALAGLALVVVYLPLEPIPGAVPFWDGPGASVAFFIGGIGFGVWFLRDRAIRSLLSGWALVIAAVCAASVLDAPALVIAASFGTLLAAAIWRLLPTLPGVPIAWLVEGLIPRAVRPLAAYRSAIEHALPVATGIVGSFATATLVGQVYAMDGAWAAATAVPYAPPAGAALLVYLLCLAGVAALATEERFREPLAALGLLVVAWTIDVELPGAVAVAAWSGLMVIGFALHRWLRQHATKPPLHLLDLEGIPGNLDGILPLTAMAVGATAAVDIVIRLLPIDRFGAVRPPEIPFGDAGALAAALLVAGILASAVIVRGDLARRIALVLTFVITAYTIPYEVYAWAVTVVWVGLALVALWLMRLDRPAKELFAGLALVLQALAAIVAVGIVAIPSRLVVGDAAVEPIVALQSAAALGAVVLGFAAVARFGLPEPWARAAWLAAGVSLVYLLSVAVVDVFAMRVGGSTSTSELRFQAQVALSVLWAALGLVAFVAGLGFRIPDLRHAGLALLALATIKVFLFDLAALDVAYRVISLVALGILLLASAWLWQRAQPKEPAPDAR